MADEPLKLRFLGSLVEQLGAQMYPSATATIAELISNAWDADARNVWVEIPLGKRWGHGDKIVVIDDGLGMSYEDAAECYLQVGRKRRVVQETDRTVGDRLLHGRKGIGKLAAFGTARILECYTVKGGIPTSFRLDYDHIRALPPSADYEVEEADDTAPLTAPGGERLETGTRITLSEIKIKRTLNEDQFIRSMSRRFALDATEMKIRINRDEISRFDYPVQFRFPPDAIPNERGLSIDKDNWAQEEIAPNQPVRWWFGFTETPLKDQSLQGISILARGKMVQRPFLFERSQGVSGQLGQEYLIGEVQADWLDTGKDIDEDRVQANRDQLQLEDAELDDFIQWGRRRLAWALGERNKLRKKKNVDQFEADSVASGLLSDLTTGEKYRYQKLAETTAQIDGMTPDGVYQVIKSARDAHDDVYVREMWEEIDKESPDVQEKVWNIIHRFSLIDARRNQTMIQRRLDAIAELTSFIDRGATEVPEIHDHLKKNTWLLDPRWQLLSDEVDVKNLGISYEPEHDGGHRMDYLFALGSPNLAESDEIVVVEIKRARTSDGLNLSASEPAVQKFHSYVAAANEWARRNTPAPTVIGLMIAENWTAGASRLIDGLAQIAQPQLRFRTWTQVIRDTERWHRTWLAVENRRVGNAEED